MLLGARQFFERRGKSEPTARDYVQTGLVAMWDGIENAGWGAHDPNATTWNDLSGNGHDGTFLGTIGTNYAWESDAFVRKSYNFQGGFGEIDLSAQMLAAAKSATFTVEVVTGAPFSSNNWQAQIFNLCQSGQGYNNGLVAFYRKENNGEVGQVYSTTYAGSGSAFLSPIDVTASVSCVLDGSTNDWYIDGVLKNSMAITPDSTIGSVLARLGSSAYAFAGRYKSYRIYSCALTAAEIAANYAIDKARFNLP